MTIRFTCAECASVLKIKDELGGTSGRCPKCRTKFIVPAPQSESDAIRLDESDHEHRVNSDSQASDGGIHASDEGDVVNSDGESLDCPPMLVLVQLSQLRTSASPQQSHRSEKSSFVADKEFFSSQPSRQPTPVIEPFDPSKFLVPDPPTIQREFAATKDSDEMPELTLSDDSDIDFEDRPEQRQISRPTPAAAATRTPSEKMDLANAAKMMKKAIKDNQAAESKQRELDASAGFDYAEIFREFGLKGLGILVGAVLASYFLYYGSNRLYSNPLHLPKLGYVKGVIKLDGQPLPGAMIYFSPIEVEMEGVKRDRIRTSVGVADTNGNFRMMYSPADQIEGVAAGRCRVWVDHIGKTGRSDVPPDWIEAAMQIKEVTPGSQKSAFEINMQSRNR